MSSNLMDRARSLTGDNLSNMIAEVVLSVALWLLRPVAITSQLLFRKRFGERYLTPINLFVGFALTVTAAFANKGIAEDGSRPVPVPGFLLVALGLTWTGLYCVEAWSHRSAVRARYAEGHRWHSRSSGFSRFGGGDRIYFELALTFGLFLVCMVIGLAGTAMLLLLSGCISGLQYFNDLRAFHNRFLDTIDGQIEAENLVAAITQKPIHPDNEGLKAPMPAYVSSKFRERSAEIIANLGAPALAAPI